ncbi:MAG: MBL fold metallo-hydrolase [Alphaproteobacteria bacterium]|nr:MBL fold metallo-hydrolase [Alphaproteobacteria bacterium]
MKWLRRIGGLLLAILIVAVSAVVWLANDRPSLQPYAAMQMSAAKEESGNVRVKFLGVATILIDDGETAILTDGFFSRPGILPMATSRIAPDIPAIDQGLKRAGITKLAAIIPVHSHYDHAMDAPEVALRTGAIFIGSQSTANIGRGWGLPETQIRPAVTGEAMRFGRFTVTLLPSRHAPTGFTGGEITSPLKPPAGIGDYLEGASYAVLVQHGDKSLLINGSAGFEPGALKDVRAEVVMLGTGGLGNFDAAHENSYWKEVVADVGAKRVIPIHWDDFITVGAGKPMRPASVLTGKLLLGDFDQMMRSLKTHADKDNVDLRLPLDTQPMNVWQALK